MSSWKDFLLGRSDTRKLYNIVYYRGFGSATAVWLKGRVLRQRANCDPSHGGPSYGTAEYRAPDRNDPFWQNLFATYQRFNSNEVPGVRVRVTAFGQEYTTVTDKHGYFDLTVYPPKQPNGESALAPGRAWFPVRYALDDVRQPDTGDPIVKDGFMMISPPFSQFGVISDIDDTVLVTGATSVLQMLRLTFLGNAYTRLPFAGVAAFYRALQSGPVTTLFNPIYYVSSSPWNLYDLLVDFFRIQGIPKGPIMLRDFSLNANLVSSAGHHQHKLAMIRKVLDVNPQLPFVLIGDSGQQDPEIYAQVVRENPGRIRAIYIRDVTPGVADSSDARDESVRELIRATEAAHVPMLLVADTVAAAEHAVTLGLIDSDTIPEIKADRRADKE